MKKYIGVKIIEAKPMSAEEASAFLNRPINTSNADLEGNGYLVKYPDGYTSWSPKAQFEEAYRITEELTFGLAIEALKKGLKVARKGWNGKGMWLMLMLTPPTSVIAIDNVFYSFLPYIQMKTVDDKMVPWLASQTDMLAEDWVIVD